MNKKNSQCTLVLDDFVVDKNSSAAINNSNFS